MNDFRKQIITKDERDLAYNQLRNNYLSFINRLTEEDLGSDNKSATHFQSNQTILKPQKKTTPYLVS